MNASFGPVWRLAAVIVTVLATIFIPSGYIASASDQYAQIRVVGLVCNTNIFFGPGPNGEWTDANTNDCYAHMIGISRIEGFNQNGDWTVWNIEEHPCEADGNNFWFVRGWWWDLSRDVYVTAGGQRFKLPQLWPGRYQWLNIGVQIDAYYYVPAPDPSYIYRFTDY